MAKVDFGQILTNLKWDFFVILLAIVSVAIFYSSSTMEISPTESDQMQGSRPPDRTEGDILLLLPDSPSPPARNFDELDCSYQWFNALWQHYGSFATLKVGDLNPEVLAGRSVVIVPHIVSLSMPSNGVSVLAGFVRKGGLVVLEKPSEVWGSLTDFSVSGESKPAQAITSVDGLGLTGPMRRHLPDVPLTGTITSVPSLPIYPKGPVLLEIDGHPGLTVTKLGKGYNYTSLFDFGCTVTALQEGRPVENMHFDIEGRDVLPASARVSHIDRENRRVPYADLLESAFFQRLSEDRPLPRLWPYPGQNLGAFLMVHPVSEQLRAGLGFADASRKLNGVSTLFVPADLLTPSEASIAQAAHADIGLNWIRGLHRPLIARYTGIGPLKIARNELTLSQQFSEVNLSLPANQPLRAGRVEGSLFVNDWATTFKQIAASRLRMDTSFGPNDRDDYGYLFGTGFPFYPIDERGLPLPMLELPYLMEGAGVTRNRLRILLEQSATYFHEVITVSIPAESMRYDPNANTLLAFRDAFKLARKNDHWITTTSELMDFLSARRSSVLTSRWDASRRILDISVNLMWSRSLTLEKGAFPGVAVPTQYNHGGISRILVDGETYNLSKLKPSGPGDEQILALGPGRHDILIQYDIAGVAKPVMLTTTPTVK